MKKKIIVVEDDDDSLFMLVTILQHNGYEAIGLKEGSIIVEDRFNWPDLFILDKEMEFYDGITITNYLKSTPAGIDVPILMVSGSTTRKEAEEAGVNLFLSKPFDSSQLLHAVESLLSPSEQQLQVI